MLARSIAILLIFSSVSMSLSGLFVFAGFELNQQYIATVLCVNKNKPELHCNGKCYLMKKLKQAEEKEQKQERQLLKIQLQEPLSGDVVTFKRYAIAALQQHIPLSTGIPLSKVNTIFHPPRYS